jgi:hypothetical protein
MSKTKSVTPNKVVRLDVKKQEDREAIFSEMDPTTQAIALEVGKKLQVGFQVALLVQHDIGTNVLNLLNQEHLNEAQKKTEIRKLAAYWNLPTLTPATIYDLSNVSAAFTRDFVKAQVEEKMSNGGYLTWNHFKELQKVSSEKRQLALLKQVRRECLSANELALELQGNKEAEVKRSGGRKPKLPRTPVAMLQKIYTTIQLADNYLEAVAEPLDGMFMEMPPQEVSEQFVSNIKNTMERIGKTKNQLISTMEKLSKVLERSQSVLIKQAQIPLSKSVMTLAAKRAIEGLEEVAYITPDTIELPEAPTKRQLRGRSPR